MRRAEARQKSAPPSAGRALRALPWLAALVASAPLLVGGFPQGHDWLFELVRAAEYGHALAEGQRPPVWAPDLYGGFGSPIFVFYAPLFSVTTALLAGPLADLARAASAVLVLASGAAALGMYVLLRSAAPEAPRAAARVAACAYVLHPYLICDALLRNANAEYLALALAPIPLAFALAAPRGARRAVLGIAAGLALVVLSHNLTALWVAAFALGAVLLARRRGGLLRSWLPGLFGIALGLLLSAGFWLPALGFSPVVRTEALLEGKFDFRRQFVPFASVFGYGRFYAIGLLPPLVWAVGVGLLRRGRGAREERRVLLLALGGCAVLLGLLLRGSTPLWEAIPFLPFFQFPWRMLGPLALLTALAAGLAFALLARGLSPRAAVAAELAVVGLCIANALPHLLDFRPLSPQVRAQLPALLTRESIASEGLAATVGDEYLPRTADPSAWRDGAPRGPLAGQSGTLSTRVVQDLGTHVELALQTETTARLELRRFAFPGWRVEVDGTPLASEVSARGAILILVEAGARRVEARLEPTALVTAARTVSALAGAAWLAIWLGPRLRRRRA
jgi:hypothetical protein